MFNKEYKSQVIQCKKELCDQQNLYANKLTNLNHEITNKSEIDYLPEMIPPEQTYKIFFRNFFSLKFF